MRGWHVALEKIMMYSAGGSIVVMMLLTSADAGGRYLLNLPIMGTYEVIEKYLMVLTLLGACYAYRTGSYVRLTFLVDHIPRRLRVAVNYIVQATSILLSFFLVAATLIQTFRTLAARSIVDVRSWSLPLWPAYAIVPLGLFFLFLAMLIDLKKVKNGESDLFKEERTDT